MNVECCNLNFDSCQLSISGKKKEDSNREYFDLPQLVVCIDLSVVVGPGMMDVDAGLQLHCGSRILFAKMDAHLRLQLIGELGSYLNTTSNCKLYGVCVCVCVCVRVCVCWGGGGGGQCVLMLHEVTAF